MKVFGLLTPYYGVLDPLAYGLYQSVLVLIVKLNICIEKEMNRECNNKLKLSIVYFKRLL